MKSMNQTENKKQTETYFYRFPSGGSCEVQVSPELAAVLHREDRIEASNNQYNRTRTGQFFSLEQLLEQGMQFTSTRDSIEHAHDIRLLRRVMAALPEEDLLLLQMIWQQGLCPTQAAHRIGISRQAGKQRLERLYRHLQEELTTMGCIG